MMKNHETCAINTNKKGRGDSDEHCKVNIKKQRPIFARFHKVDMKKQQPNFARSHHLARKPALNLKSASKNSHTGFRLTRLYTKI